MSPLGSVVSSALLFGAFALPIVCVIVTATATGSRYWVGVMLAIGGFGFGAFLGRPASLAWRRNLQASGNIFRDRPFF